MANEEFEVFPVDSEDDDVCVTLELDNGGEMTCEILTIFDCGERDYIVLLPIKENGKEIKEKEDVVIYRYEEEEDGTPVLDNIASEEEYLAVSKRFEEWQDETYGTEDDDEE